jgi:hypothetical protein
MSVPAKQIGWSQESNLLWEIAKELDRTLSVLCTGGCPTTTTTTTTLSLVFREGFGYTPGGSPCQSPEPVPLPFPYYVTQSCFDNLTVGCYLYADENLNPSSEGYYIGWTEGVTYFYINSSGQVVNINICPQP